MPYTLLSVAGPEWVRMGRHSVEHAQVMRLEVISKLGANGRITSRLRSGGALEPVDEPGGPESTRAFEAQMREAIRLPTGWHRSIAQSGRGGNWRRARHSRPGQ